MTQSGYIALAAVAGALIPMQALINARIGAQLGGPFFGVLVNFIVGTAAMMAVLAAMRAPMPAAAQISAAPWWAWLGGFMGAYFVLAATLAVPKLGAAGLTSIIIAGQLVSALALDHYGVLNSARPLNLDRIFGALLLAAGAILILRR